MIYHVTTRHNWDLAIEQGMYHHESLITENFIHACSKEQLPGVIHRYYRNTPSLILLQIDETLLNYPLKYEESPSTGDFFPHIYGPINLDAVIHTEPYDHME